MKIFFLKQHLTMNEDFLNKIVRGRDGGKYSDSESDSEYEKEQKQETKKTREEKKASRINLCLACRQKINLRESHLRLTQFL